jgi:predicted HTH transcriptional regulator
MEPARNFLRETEIAEEIGVSVPKLRADRHNGKGLPYIRIGRRILYDREEVFKYLRSRTVRPEEALA